MGQWSRGARIHPTTEAWDCRLSRIQRRDFSKRTTSVSGSYLYGEYVLSTLGGTLGPTASATGSCRQIVTCPDGTTVGCDGNDDLDHNRHPTTPTVWSLLRLGYGESCLVHLDGSCEITDQSAQFVQTDALRCLEKAKTPAPTTAAAGPTRARRRTPTTKTPQDEQNILTLLIQYRR